MQIENSCLLKTPNSKCNEKKPTNWTKFSWFWVNVITKYWKHIFFFLSNSKSYLGEKKFYVLKWKKKTEQNLWKKQMYQNISTGKIDGHELCTHSIQPFSWCLYYFVFRLLESNGNRWPPFCDCLNKMRAKNRSNSMRKKW